MDMKTFLLSKFIQHDGPDVVPVFQNLKRKNTLFGTSSQLHRKRLIPKRSKRTLLIFREKTPQKVKCPEITEPERAISVF